MDKNILVESILNHWKLFRSINEAHSRGEIDREQHKKEWANAQRICSTGIDNAEQH